MPTTRLAACLCAAALSACQVADDGTLCSYLNDNCGTGGQDDPPSDDPPPVYDVDPCDLIGQVTGQQLRPVSDDIYPAWWGAFVSGVQYLMRWSILFPAGWIWHGDAGVDGQPAALELYDGEVWLYDPGTSLPTALYQWVQVDGLVLEATLGENSMGFAPGPDGESTILFAPPLPALGVGGGWLSIVGAAHLRGWVSPANGVSAGPGAGNQAVTSHQMRHFHPSGGYCEVAHDGVSPPDHGSFNACEVLEVALGTPLETAPSLYSAQDWGGDLVWSGLSVERMFWDDGEAAFLWDGELPAFGERAVLDSTTDDLWFDVYGPADGSEATIAYVVTNGALAPGVGVDLLSHPSVGEAGHVEFADPEFSYAAVLWHSPLVPDQGAGYTWHLRGGLDARGLATSWGGLFGGVAEPHTAPTAQLEDAGDVVSFQPSVGYCRPSGAGLDDSGGLADDDEGDWTSTSGGDVLDGTTG